MKRHLIISSVLALGMGIAQAQTQPTTPAPMQSGTGDQRPGIEQQQTPPAAAQGVGTGNESQAASQSFKGCLNGSSGSWSLTSDQGKNMNLSGTDSQLSQYKGQEVRIQGVQSNDGSITVASVDKISDTCANQSAGNTNQTDINNQSSTTTTSTTQSATATQPSSSDNMSQSNQPPATSTTPDNSSAMNNQSSSTATNTPGATTPPVSNQTPDNTVGSGQTSQSTPQSTTSTSDQNAASSPTSNDQNTTANQNNNNQNANQGIHQYSDMDQNAANNSGQRLPQTASPLPLLGLLGLGSLVTGLISRRKK